MSVFNKSSKKSNPLADFENAFVNKKVKPNPVVKAGSIVLYVILIVAVVACLLMAVLDKKGVVPSSSPESGTVQTSDTSSSAAVSDNADGQNNN